MFEINVPSIPDRIAAMQKCAQAGYPIRSAPMPITAILKASVFMAIAKYPSSVRHLSLEDIADVQKSNSQLTRNLIMIQKKGSSITPKRFQIEG